MRVATSMYPPGYDVPVEQRPTLDRLRRGPFVPAKLAERTITAAQRAHALQSIRRPMQHWTPHRHRPDPLQKGPARAEESSNA